MFRQTAMNAEVEHSDNYEDAFLLSLFYGLGFGTNKNYSKMVQWCSEAASRGSPLAQVVLVPFSNISGCSLSSNLPITDWLLKAVEQLSVSRDLESVACAFRALKQRDEPAYHRALSLYKEKVRIWSIASIVGSGNGGQLIWEKC